MSNDSNPGKGLILASKSKWRAVLLENAGLDFSTEAANVDERAIEEPLNKSGLDAADIAQILAEAKALEVSARNSDELVIGCDQTLSLDGIQFHKPQNMEEARRHLLQFSGKTHQLNSAIVLARNGEAIWRYVARADMTMRPLTPAFIGRYLAMAGDVALTSVGAYQVEGPGIQLFDRIEGDYFTIMGLPLLPLLAKLREHETIDG